jgi:hypothetical protein
VLDARNATAGKTTFNHIDDFEKSLLSKGSSSKHAKLVSNRARRVMRECRFQFWSDLSASKVQSRIADLRDNDRVVSIQTQNFYLQAVKQFGKWMVRDGRASESPLEPAGSRKRTTGQ